MTDTLPPRRGLSGLDHLLSRVDQQLRRFAGDRGSSPQNPIRPSPAHGHDEPTLSGREREHAAGLMRVNHTGEVCAQALYQGQAMMARRGDTREKLLDAAQEEGTRWANTAARARRGAGKLTRCSMPRHLPWAPRLPW